MRWVEMKKSRGADRIHLRAAPFLVGPVLEEGLWRSVPTCVLTSATLAVDGSFDYMSRRLGFDGLSPDRYRCLRLPSPFEWKERAVLLVPDDVADVGTADFDEELRRWIVEAARITRGRTFVLFTSYTMLDRAHAATGEALRDLGLVPLRQGTAPRTALLDEFRRSGRAVLFGTESFWQGVDVRGDALSCVVIARLPFAVPTEPLQVARMEEVKEGGGDPFRDYSLPQAVLKLRQGVGRLIRSSTDRGAVIILDRRIGARSYGRAFLRSLPPLRTLLAPTETLLGELGEFFGAPGEALS